MAWSAFYDDGYSLRISWCIGRQCEDLDWDNQEEEVDEEVAVTLVNGLRKEGWTVRTLYATSSWGQAKVKSSIKTFKRCFKAAQMPGTVPLTIVSFSRCVQNCASLMNTRPIVILPPSLSDPDELMTVSPSSLRGPSDSSWTSLGAGGDYRGQQALQASLLKRSVLETVLCPEITVKWPNG